MKDMEIKIDKLGTNSVLGTFAKQYIENMSDYTSFDVFMVMYRGCTVQAKFTATSYDFFDKEVISNNQAFCEKYHLKLEILEE